MPNNRVKIGEVEVEGTEPTNDLGVLALALFKATGGQIPTQTTGLGFANAERAEPGPKEYGEREAGW